MVDLTTSAYYVSKMVLKPDSWRLFRCVNADYIRSYKVMGAKALVFEGAVAGAECNTVIELTQEHHIA